MLCSLIMLDGLGKALPMFTLRAVATTRTEMTAELAKETVFQIQSTCHAATSRTELPKKHKVLVEASPSISTITYIGERMGLRGVSRFGC